MPIMGALDVPHTAMAAAAGVSATLSAAFDGALIRAASGKAYVPRDHRARSLGAIEVPPDRIVFFEDNYNAAKTRLRARVTDNAVLYDMSVTADAARTRWKTAGLAALQGDLQAGGRVHLRVGLSRPFPAMPNQCYAQINGVYVL